MELQVTLFLDAYQLRLCIHYVNTRDPRQLNQVPTSKLLSHRQSCLTQIGLGIR